LRKVCDHGDFAGSGLRNDTMQDGPTTERDAGMPFRPCILIPVYNNPRTIERVVEGVRRCVPDVLVVDDGSTDETGAVLDRLADTGLVQLRRLRRNEGKGAALATGFAAARELGFTHALQVDGDAQHDLGCLPAFLDAARRDPEALVLGYPVFDDSVPWIRAQGRKLSQWLVNVETGGRVIDDPLIGFRVYPVAATLAAAARGRRMDIDIELAVRMVWMGTPVINLPVGVRYLPADEGGVSHFRMIRDNALIAWLHTRLIVESAWRRLRGEALSGRGHRA